MVSDFFVDDEVIALAGVREHEAGAIVRTRRGQLVPRLRGRARAEVRGDDVRVRWHADEAETWYPAPLLMLGRQAVLAGCGRSRAERR